MNAKIDFLIIGAQKAGTTSLYEYLSQHPAIFMPKEKDLPFFVDAGTSEVREQDLHYFYGHQTGEQLLGGSFVHLLYYPEAPQRIRRYRPDMRLIAILRDPIDRAYSAYWFARREGYETAQTFEEALAREPLRSRGSRRDRNELTYLAHGNYEQQLTHYFEFFDRAQMQIYLYEDLKEDADWVLSTTFAWLGMRDWNRPIATTGIANAASLPKSRLLQRTLIVPPEPISRLYHRIVPRALRYRVNRNVIALLRRLNTRPFRYPPMEPATRQRLLDHFGPMNEKLSALIGRDLSHWK